MEFGAAFWILTALVLTLSFGLGFLFSRLQMAQKLRLQHEDLIRLQKEVEISQQSAASRTQIKEEVSQVFANLSREIFEDRQRIFQEQTERQLSGYLAPFKEKLSEFTKKVDEAYSTDRVERGTLKGEISKLVELNQRITFETNNLTKALKGDQKLQGNWGEYLLESILEKSGLRKDEEYVLQGSQMSLKNDRGEIMRPDVLVKLPEGKHLIIDSKVSLVAFERAINSDSPEEQQQGALAHADSIKRHVDGLSSKRYSSAEALQSPDMVLMFMPIEPALSMAFKVKPDLLSYAWDKGIAIVSPTTLLTTLKTVSFLWIQERQQKNAQEIAKRGGLLYDKFVGFLSDMELVTKKIEEAREAHTEAISKIKSGSGNLVSQVEKLRNLGAKADKKIAEKWIEDE